MSVILDTLGDGEIELDLSYLVSNASWQPQYDIRVATKDQDKKTMQVSTWSVLLESPLN